jgi:serine phosphatase RsbU (regulator of sigma subunit)
MVGLRTQKTTVTQEQLIAWGVASRTLAGQAVSGDLHLVQSFSGGILMAVLDGIGHGEEAAAAVTAAVAVLQRHPEESPTVLIRRCHAALSNTRGAVMTVASLDPLAGELTWVGVGNVEALLVRADINARPATERVVLRGGLIGYQLPELRASTTAIAAGDLLIFSTDGIRPGFARGLVRTEPPRRIANQIMRQNLKRSDDALVLVVRYLGKGDG